MKTLPSNAVAAMEVVKKDIKDNVDKNKGLPAYDCEYQFGTFRYRVLAWHSALFQPFEFPRDVAAKIKTYLQNTVNDEEVIRLNTDYTWRQNPGKNLSSKTDDGSYMCLLLVWDAETGWEPIPYSFIDEYYKDSGVVESQNELIKKDFTTKIEKRFKEYLGNPFFYNTRNHPTIFASPNKYTDITPEIRSKQTEAVVAEISGMAWGADASSKQPGTVDADTVAKKASSKKGLYTIGTLGGLTIGALVASHYGTDITSMLMYGGSGAGATTFALGVFNYLGNLGQTTEGAIKMAKAAGKAVGAAAKELS